MNTQETNKLIAEFIGCKSGLDEKGNDLVYFNNRWGDRFLISDLKYNTSWDWLMPVVEKIENLGYHTKLTGYKEKWRFKIILTKRPLLIVSQWELNSTSKIETVYKCIIRFIQWYNENHK
jgi:hypothetical protein